MLSFGLPLPLHTLSMRRNSTSPTVVDCCVRCCDFWSLPLVLLQISHSMSVSSSCWAASRLVLSRMRSRSVAVFVLRWSENAFAWTPSRKSCVGTRGRAQAPSCSMHVAIFTVFVPTPSCWRGVPSAVMIASTAPKKSCCLQSASLWAIPSSLAMALGNVLDTRVSSDKRIVFCLGLRFGSGVAMCWMVAVRLFLSTLVMMPLNSCCVQHATSPLVGV